MDGLEHIAEGLETFNSLKASERRFVEAFVADPRRNGTEAALAAEYGNGNKESAAVAASRLLKKDKIQTAISELETALRGESSLLPRIIAAYMAIAFSDLRDVMRWDGKGRVTLIPSSELSPAASFSIASIQDIQEEKQSRLPGLDDETEAAVNIIRRNVKQHDKLKGLEGLTRILGFGAPDRLEISGDLYARLERARHGAIGREA